MAIKIKRILIVVAILIPPLILVFLNLEGAFTHQEVKTVTVDPKPAPSPEQAREDAKVEAMKKKEASKLTNMSNYYVYYAAVRTCKKGNYHFSAPSDFKTVTISGVQNGNCIVQMSLSRGDKPLIVNCAFPLKHMVLFTDQQATMDAKGIKSGSNQLTPFQEAIETDCKLTASK